MVISPIESGLTIVGVEFADFTAGLLEHALLLDLRPFGGGLVILAFGLDSEGIIARIVEAAQCDADALIVRREIRI